MAYYLDWGSTSSKRIELSSEILLPADFEIEMSVVNLANSSFILSGGSSSGGFEIYRNGSGRLQIFISGISVFNGAIPLNNDKESPQTLRISRDTANNITVFIDGQQDGAGFVSSGTLKIKTVGQRPSGSWFNNSNMALYSLSVSKSQALTNRYIKQTLNGSNDTVLPDAVNGNDGTLINFPTDNSQWVFYDDGGSEPEPELHEFSGNAVVNALSLSQATKITQHNGLALVNVSASGQFAKSVTLSSDSLVTASATAASAKVINTNGSTTVVAESVSLFKKLNAFNGNASVSATSQSSASKLVEFDGQATVSVTASASIIDGNFEIHSFSGGAVITATATGQAAKIGLVSGGANITTSTSAQASKTAQLSGNATTSASTQSLFSKIASISGNAKTRVTTLATAIKRVTLFGASRVVATAYGTFFNTESNVETYELTVQGRVKAPIVVQGTIKSLTIQGRVK